MTAAGQAEGIDHGTPRGARQHVRRRVLPVCTPCEEAIAAEREGEARDANTGRKAAFNTGPKARADKSMAGSRQVTAARELTAKERRAMARLLAGGADNADDLRELLDAVGLTAADGKAAIATTTSSTSGDC